MNIISKFPEKDNRKEWWYIIPVGLMFTLCLVGFGILVYLILSLPDYFSESTELVGEPIQHVQEFVVPQTETIEEKPEPVVHLTDDDILVAVAMHEAGNQDILGMAFVIMTILNRCDYYDATVEQIVTAPNQYAYPYYGAISHDAYIALDLAKEYRDIFKPIAWFQTGEYPSYGEHAFKWGDHYFCYIPEEEE